MMKGMKKTCICLFILTLIYDLYTLDVPSINVIKTSLVKKKKVFISSFSLRCSCQDGTFLPNGRSSNVILQAGHQPAVLVWDCMTLAFISELKCHQYGVVCIAFSPDG